MMVGICVGVGVSWEVVLGESVEGGVGMSEGVGLNWDVMGIDEGEIMAVVDCLVVKEIL